MRYPRRAQAPEHPIGLNDARQALTQKFRTSVSAFHSRAETLCSLGISNEIRCLANARKT
ncbi:hypothetical protein CCU68_18565 [Pseudomonas gingeri NCPPB 3146 = LMG 5327]|uniref:Uncharacterized protein n=1 Tax=Pseudomonas gingeri NCPPB 3146 = LMG 5327 TaxID=707248 RepID=A0ABX4Y1J4_9PSED|nr:hypothetical protein CCU68_18565 [Pseudomonas gingeri NCPPB 3146 = LMG 5327]